MNLNSDIIEELRTEFGEAFYLLDSEQFRKNFLELKQAFMKYYDKFNISYSYKTNYTPKLCKIVNELGGYAEVVSEMEMELALRCGIKPEKIIWNGPIKNTNTMFEFLLSGGVVNIDSLDEAMEIKAFADAHKENILHVGIRCNYDVEDNVISRFGLDVNGEDFQKVVNLIYDTENLEFMNFQCHFAKRQIEYWPARAKGMLDVIKKSKLAPKRIDIGGGLFGKMPEELKQQFSCEIPSYEDYARAAATVFAEYYKACDERPELIIEPGSALVGDCMKFVGTVKTIKKVRGKFFASVLGSQKNISMSGVNPPMQVIPMGKKQVDYDTIDFVGFTCIEGDVLYHNYKGALAEGDAIVISNCGSYSLVMKPPFILPNFPVLDITEGKTEIIKRAECFDDIFHTFVI